MPGWKHDCKIEVTVLFKIDAICSQIATLMWRGLKTPVRLSGLKAGQALAVTATLLILPWSQISEARQAVPSDTNLLGPLFACLDQTAEPTRLACLDREARKLRQTGRDRGVLVLDREAAGAIKASTKRIEEAARQKQMREMASSFTPIDAHLAAATQRHGLWVFEVEGHGLWVQTTSGDLGRDPQSGDRIRVRRGPLGGFLLNVRTGPAIRVKPEF